MLQKTINKQRQQGIVLVMGMVFLLLLTLLAVSGMQIGTLEQRISGNFKAQGSVFEAAELALRVGEKDVEDHVSRDYGQNQNGYYEFDPDSLSNDTPRWERASTWQDGGSQQVTNLPAELTAHHYDVRYYIEKIEDFWQTTYRVTARAQGNNSNPATILQSTYTLRDN